MAQVKPVNKKKMTKSSLIATVVAVVILVAFALSLVSTSGLFVRATTGASSENFTVNGSMMSYFFNSYYSNWYSNYYYYIMYGLVNFDPNTALDKQYTDSTKEQTWYDYFVEGTKSTVTSYLKYCEEAMVDPEVNYSELEADAKAYASESIASIKASAKAAGTDFTTYVRQYLGKYIGESDLEKALVIEHIAIEYYQTVYDRIFDGVTEAKEDDYLKNHIADLISAEYLTFTLSSQKTPATIDEKLYDLGKEDPAYKEAVAKAEEEAKTTNDFNKVLDKEFIDKLATAKSAEEFKRILLDYKYDETFKSAYDTAVKSFADSDKPSETEWKEFAASIKQAAIDAVIDGKTSLDNATSSDSTAEKTKWETAKESLPASVITALNSVITNATKTTSYTLSTDLGKFLFSGVKDQYGLDYAEGEEKGTNAKVNDYLIEDKTMTEEEQKYGKYSLSVYFVTKEADKDETLLRNAGHILFKIDAEGKNGAYKTSEEAKAAAEKLLAEIKGKAVDGVVSEEVFEEMAQNTHDSQIFYTGVTKGYLVEEFDKWLFDAKTVGELGLVYGESSSYKGWHIVYYNGEEMAWRMDAHEGIASEEINAWSEDLKHTVTINDSIFEKIYN